jgi:uncharacterized protein YjbI with pentapeptide repeats
MSIPTRRLALTLEELDPVIASHGRWLKRQGAPAEQVRANLSGVPLYDADLSGADLRRACLRGALLEGAVLRGAQLQWADLQDADLRNAVLHGAQLQHANLRGANLTGARGLLPGQLAGCDLSGARLPDQLARFEGLAAAGDLARNANKLMFIVLLVCVYCLLTVASTTDLQLITNEVSSRLPIFEVDVRIGHFYWGALILLLLTYLYFLLGLAELWLSLSLLPSVFPDGGAVTQRVPGWPFTAIAERGLPRVQRVLAWRNRRRRWLHSLRHGILLVIVYLPVPLTLIALGLRYASKHSSWESMAQVILVIGAIVLPYILRPFAWLRQATPVRRGGPEKGRTLRPVLVNAAGSAALLFAVGPERPPLTDSTMDARQEFPERADSMDAYCHPNDSLTASLRLKRAFQALLDEAPISKAPGVWDGDDDIAHVELASPAHLNKRDLVSTSARRAFLVRAQMRKVRLDGACLQKAIMTRVHLEGSWLRKAFLDSAQLTGAHLEGADLGGASFVDAIMPGAHLESADLRNARLDGADLTKAHLDSTQLDSATLIGTNLAGATLKGSSGLTRRMLDSAANWILAEYGSHPILESLPTGSRHDTLLHDRDLANVRLDSIRLRGADLFRFILNGSHLSRADLRSARMDLALMRTAWLEHAKLGGASLVGAQLDSAHLTGAVLAEAKLRGSSLAGAVANSVNFFGADLSGSDIRGGSLRGAKLIQADLIGADLGNAVLDSADLTGADLTCAVLTGASLVGIRGWEKIRSFRGAEIAGVRRAPSGFRAFAWSKGALRPEGQERQDPRCKRLESDTT